LVWKRCLPGVPVTRAIATKTDGKLILMIDERSKPIKVLLFSYFTADASSLLVVWAPDDDDVEDVVVSPNKLSVALAKYNIKGNMLRFENTLQGRFLAFCNCLYSASKTLMEKAQKSKMYKNRGNCSVQTTIFVRNAEN